MPAPVKGPTVTANTDIAGDGMNAIVDVGGSRGGHGVLVPAPDGDAINTIVDAGGSPGPAPVPALVSTPVPTPVTTPVPTPLPSPVPTPVPSPVSALEVSCIPCLHANISVLKPTQIYTKAISSCASSCSRSYCYGKHRYCW